MLDRIFQDRLQRQTQDRIVHQRIGNLDGIGERVMKASLHDVQIAFRDLQLLPQRDDQTALAQNAAIEVGKVVDQICGLLPVIKLDQRADIVQCIIQEMRVDLLVQQFKLHFPLLTLLTDKPVCRRANGGDHAVKFLGKNAHLIVRPDREMHIPVSVMDLRHGRGQRRDIACELCGNGSG